MIWIEVVTVREAEYISVAVTQTTSYDNELKHCV